MAAGPEMRRDHAEHRQEPVGCAGGAFMAGWRCRVGWCEFSARLFRYLDCRYSTDAITARCATG